MYGSVLIIAGDVTGKGLEAGMLVALLVGAIRSTVEMTGEPIGILQALNRRLLGRSVQNSRRRQLGPTTFQAIGTGRVGHRQAGTEAVCVGKHGEEPRDSGVSGGDGQSRFRAEAA